jgi:hypothetical protein
MMPFQATNIAIRGDRHKGVNKLPLKAINYAPKAVSII